MAFLFYDPIYDRIYKRFDINEQTECWEWNGTRTNDGYPTISYQGKTVLVHRKMYELRWGPIPAGYEVDHTCHHPCCICPDHLEAVSPSVNRARRSDYIAQRDNRLRKLVTHLHRDLLYPGILLESTVLARLWQCRSHDVPHILAHMALYPGFHYANLRRGHHGPKPSLFQIYLERSIVEDVNSVCRIKKIIRADVVNISIEIDSYILV
jgi:hypothetical protein